jgi:NAD(P)H-dependent flavin oxidoreductase YrpB (nitropropane dioxygenase family)
VSRLRTPICDLLGSRYPIIQTAMGWVAKPPLVAASCNAGAFGFLACAVMSPEEVGPAIDQVRALTDKPFGVNFHMFQPGAAQIVETVIAKKVAAVSFGRGPDRAMIARFKEAGICCIPTVGAVKHAQKMVELGVDAIVVQGGEGGGHTGSVASTILLPQVLDAVKVPVMAAGGFADGRGLAAALAYGAQGIAMGTRFLMTQESPAPEAVKQRYAKVGTDDIFVTDRLDGIPQRMIRNRFTAQLERSGAWRRLETALRSGLEIKKRTGASFAELLGSAKAMGHGNGGFAQAMLSANAPMMIRRAIEDGDAEGGVMATGLVAGRLGDLPTCEALVSRIVAEAEARLEALARLSGPAPQNA